MSKPDVKVFFKAVDGSGYVDLCAFWRGDNGMLRGKLDRNVKAIKVVLADGSEKVLRMSEKGIVDGYYLNVRMEDSSPPAKAGYVRAAPVTRGTQKPALDFPDDDVPF